MVGLDNQHYEVGFDICGTEPETEYPANQGKPRCIQTLPCISKFSLNTPMVNYCMVTIQIPT